MNHRSDCSMCIVQAIPSNVEGHENYIARNVVGRSRKHPTSAKMSKISNTALSL